MTQQGHPADRLGIVQAEEGRASVDDDALAREMADLGTVLRMIGGTVTVMADRDEVAPGVYATWMVRWRWRSGGPAARRGQPPPEAEVVEAEAVVEDVAEAVGA